MNKRRAIILLVSFSLGIVIPSVSLAILGIRSLRYENLLLKKKSEEQLSSLADLVKKKIDDYFSMVAQSFRPLSESEAFKSYNRPAMAVWLMSELPKGPISFSRVYVFDNQNNLVVPSILGGPTATASSLLVFNWGYLKSEIERIEKIEFVQKDIGEALRLYSDLSEKTLSPAQRALVKKTIASCHRKLGNASAAEKIYSELIAEYDQAYDPSGYPMGVVGLRLLTSVYKEQGHSEKHARVSMELFEGILFDRWGLTASQKEMLLSEITETINQVRLTHGDDAGVRRQLDRLVTLQGKLKEYKKDAELFIKEEWPYVLSKIGSQGLSDQPYIFQRNNHNSHKENGIVVIVMPLMNLANTRTGFMVGTIQNNLLWSQLRQMVNELTTPSGVEVLFDSIDNNEREDKAQAFLINRSVTSIDPPLNFSLKFPFSKEQKQILYRRLRISQGMILLSLLVIVAGVLFSARAIRQETEMANLKSDFVMNVSHELRTPLTSIAYISERLKNRRYSSEEEAQEFLDMLEQESGRLKELVEDILNFSKVISGKRAYERHLCNLVNLAEEACLRFEGRARAKGFSVSLASAQIPLQILADERDVIQAIMNLLDNALKYSPVVHQIELSTGMDGAHAWVSVKDFGIGIKTVDQKRIFEQFYCVDKKSVRSGEGGVGLGLAMVKHIVEAHGGEVRIMSDFGKGSTFILMFPLAISIDRGA